MNWGIIGYGDIAPSFIEGLKASKDSRLVGIASISAWEFLNKKKLHENIKIYKTHEGILENPEIEIIYVCTTNNLHFKNTLDAIHSGKHVLCEKPITPSQAETEELIKVALEKNVLIMEGMWSRFLPAYQEALKIIKRGDLGKPKLLKSDFGFFNKWPTHRRLLNPLLLGGTLLDNADYNIFLSQDIFEDFPNDIKAQATFAETGVEDACSILLKYPSGGLAQLYSSFRCETNQEAIIYCEKGYVKLYEFWHGTKIEIRTEGEVMTREYPFIGNGFEYEIEAFEESIAMGKTENEIVSHGVSCDVAAIIDKVKTII